MEQDAEGVLAENCGQEYLTFSLGCEEYALDILNVQEIRSYEEPTRIANAPEHIRGVINLRGTIVPVVDMRIKFHSGRNDYTPTTVVIILNIGGQLIGIIVDSVTDVAYLRSDQIRQVPQFGATVDTSYIRGMAMQDERTLMVIYIEKLIQAGDIAAIGQAA